MGRGDNQGAVPAEDAAEHVPPKAEELPRPLLVAWLGLGFRVRVRARVGLGLGLELGLWLGFHGLLVAVLLLRDAAFERASRMAVTLVEHPHQVTRYLMRVAS